MTPMTRGLRSLQHTQTLWLLGIASLLMIALSDYLKWHWQLQLLDGIWNPLEARELVAQLNLEQKNHHLWFTTTVDVILPLVVAAFMAAATLRAFPRWGRYLAIAPLLAVPLDLSEGVIQVLVLTDTADWLAIKAYTSPVKSSGYLIGLFAVGLSLCKWLFTLVRSKFLGRAIDDSSTSQP
ncbi:MAG: hypothetical protein CL693_05925 [Cellvibrionaceae bacterium]|nr:hypothetical protein [Cellvibrionaceae bacterium]